MKTSIAQTALSLLLIGSAILFSGLIMGGYWHVQGTDGEFGVMVSGNPGRNTPMETWFWCYLGLGLAVLAAGITSFFLKARTSKSWLASVQVVLGGLVVISLVAYMVWVEPDWVPYTKLSDHTGNLVLMSNDATWVAQQIIWKAASILVGLGVVGLGLVQLRRFRRAR
jgi:hypothetical protein